jgi:hypothetical protein
MNHSGNYIDRGLALYWEPETPAKFINFAYDTKALVALEQYFGAFPITIRREDIKILQALQTAGGGRPLDDLIRIVEQNDSIRIWWDKQSKNQDIGYRFASMTG